MKDQESFALLFTVSDEELLLTMMTGGGGQTTQVTITIILY